MLSDSMVMMSASIVVLATSGLVVFYAYVGYPFVLCIMSRFASKGGGAKNCAPELADPDCPDAVVLIVAHNESQQISRKIEGCLAQDYPVNKLRVLIVSVGSTDDTVSRVRAVRDPRVRVIENDKRQGKAACINVAMAQITEEFVVLADVRQRLSGKAVRHLLSHFVDSTVGVVTGELRLEHVDGEYWFERGVTSYWQREVELRRLEASVHSVVGATGALYALRRAAFAPIPDRTILDDVLIPMNAVMSGYRVRFESRAHAFDKPVSDLARERQRKVRTLAGNFQLITIRSRLLNPGKNPIFFQFVSHKIMRLLVPLAMLSALLSSAVLASYHWMFGAMFVAQIAAYVLATLPEKVATAIAIGPLRTLRTFVLMHWFVVLGLREFLLNRDAHLWDVSSSAKSRK